MSLTKPGPHHVKELKYYPEFCRRNFIPPKAFDIGQLVSSGSSDFQVAGHSGFLKSGPNNCLKPMNPKCVRSRREHLFYQLAKYFDRETKPEPLYYKDFILLIDPAKKCDCMIEPETFTSIRRNIPQFLGVYHPTLNAEDFEINQERRMRYFDNMYSDSFWCPCYGTDEDAKNKCSRTYSQDNYLCMEDLQSHCGNPCVLDIKVGRITYDPMAHEKKVNEQLFKYPRVRDFGFRILGMKTSTVVRDKSYGKTLETQELVFEAIESFFEPLQATDRKVMVIGKMLDRLEYLLEWFETKNECQLRFYSSSLLFVYDNSILAKPGETNQEALVRLGQSVRVSMIDFAHVFHSHAPPEGPSRSGSGTSIHTSGTLNKDDNYLYGLRRLVKFFIMMNRQHRIRLQSELTESGQQ